MPGIEPAIPGLQGECFMDGLQFICALAHSAISLKAPILTAADDKFWDIILYFRKK